MKPSSPALQKYKSAIAALARAEAAHKEAAQKAQEALNALNQELLAVEPAAKKPMVEEPEGD